MKYYNKILEAVNRGIKFALDDFEDQEEIQGQTNSKIKHNYGTKEWLDLMKEAVDLGLPSGTLWCKYNLGVDPNQLTSPKNWYGGYYAWGELEANKPKYNWDHYKFGNDYIELTKYCNNSYNGLNGFTDNLTELLPEDDAAYQTKIYNYNFKFHIPTKEQCEELINFTKNYFVRNYDSNKIVHNLEDDGGVKELNGIVFEGMNGNQMFIPTAGYYYDSNFLNDRLYFILWSSSLYLNNPGNAYYMYFDILNQHRVCIYNGNRCHGFNIRPVINL